MEQAINKLYDLTIMGEVDRPMFLQLAAQIIGAEVERQTKEFDECLTYLLQPNVEA